MSLPYWVEELLTMSAPNTNLPSTLCYHTGVEYLYPMIPPNLSTYFITAPTQTARVRGIQIYGFIHFRMTPGFIMPDVFRLTAVTRGITAYDGTLTGYHLALGFDDLIFVSEDSQLVTYITNMSPMNQYFEMISEYLVVPSEENWKMMLDYMRRIHLPVDYYLEKSGLK